MPSPPPSTIVVVTWRGAGHIGRCLDAVAAQGRPHRTIVVDNASEDGTAAMIADHPSAPQVLRLHKNAGYAGGIAAALCAVDTRYIAWLNDDAEPSPDWLGLLEDALDGDPEAAAASARLERSDGSTQSIGVRLTANGYGFDLNGVIEDPRVFGFCGGAALLRTGALRAVGGVPAEFFCYYEDTDTSWRLRQAGWRVLAVPAARVRHTHGASSRLGSADFHLWNERNRLLMLLRCAPADVAARECARFAAITVLLPLRRLFRRGVVAPTPNFRLSLRLRAMAGVARRLPTALRTRRATAATAMTVSRRDLWRRWAGNDAGDEAGDEAAVRSGDV